jgi:thioredoxin 1
MIKKIINAEGLVLTEGKISLLKFEADWCGPCKAIKPLIEEIASERTDIQVYSIDVDIAENYQLLSKWKVSSLPSLILVSKDGQHKSLIGAAKKKEILAFIDE